jgi:hypothetical protein
MPDDTRGDPRDWDLWTPITPELLALLERMRVEYGTWSEVAAVSHTKKRVLRRLHRAERKVVSMTLLDRLMAATGIGHLDEFVWFTAEDLVKLGIWKKVRYVEGRKSFDEGHHLTVAERRRLKKRRERALRDERRLLAVGQEIVDEGQRHAGKLPWDY